MKKLLAILFALTCVAACHAEVQWWTTNSLDKVMPDDPAPIVKRRSLSLASARNEVEAAQVCLRPDRAISLVGATADGLKGVKTELFEVRTVELQTYGRFYPDALPPLKLPLALPVATTTSIWVSLRVPKNAKPGDYSATVHLKFDDGTSLAAPMSLHVWDFELPVKPSMRTAFGVAPDLITKFEGLKPGTPEAQKMYVKYWESALDHRISLYGFPADFTSKEADKFVNDPRLTSFVAPYSEDDKALKQTIEHIKKKGWYDKAFFYPTDEPITKPQHDELVRMSGRIRKFDSKVKIVCPFWGNPDFTTKTAYEVMSGLVNIWCPCTPIFDFTATQEKQKKGEEVWWYVCNGPGKPWANVMIDHPGTANRVLFWQQRKNDVRGFLYWDVDYWVLAPDPWVDQSAPRGPRETVYGDGMLFYPGKTVGVDGPVSCIRLEIIRDALEDYEYFTILDKHAGKAVTEKLIDKLVTSMTEFEHNPVKFEAVRRELGDAVEASLKK